MIFKDNNSALDSVRYHIGLMFDFEATHVRNCPGGSLWFKLLILMYVDILPRFYLMEDVVILDVYIKPSLVTSWLGGEGGLEGLGNASFDIVFVDKGSKVWDSWWWFIGEEGANLTAWGVFARVSKQYGQLYIQPYTNWWSDLHLFGQSNFVSLFNLRFIIYFYHTMNQLVVDNLTM